MNTKRETSINIAITILRQLMKGRHLTVGDDVVAMSDNGHVGYILGYDKNQITGDLTIRELAMLVEKYGIIPIPEVRK